MTIKEAILKSLDEIGKLTNYTEVTNHIIAKNYYDFKDAKTPPATISALLGDFVRVGDSRVKRIKESCAYFYYLTKNEENIGIEILTGVVEETKIPKAKKTNFYEERDLLKC